MKTIPLSAVLNQEDDGYVSLCTELDIASQGSTVEEALSNLKEAVEGFFETVSPEEVQQRLKNLPFSHTLKSPVPKLGLFSGKEVLIC